MIAFKTYSDCPSSIKDQDTFNEMPWLVEEIADHLKDDYEAQGFIVLTKIDFDAYMTSIKPVTDQYEAIKRAKNQAMAFDQYLDNLLTFNQSNGLKIIIKYGKRNLINRKTESEIDMIMEDLDIIKLCVALISGSYKYALRKVDLINNPAISEADKQFFKDEIKSLM